MKHKFIHRRPACTRRIPGHGKFTCDNSSGGNNTGGSSCCSPEQGSVLSCLLLWVLGLALITYFCVINHWPTVQARLQSDVETAVQTAGVAQPGVTLAGRDVRLQGVVSSTQIMQKATAAAGLVAGIRSVTNNQTVTQDIIPSRPKTKPSFSFRTTANEIALTGRVPTVDVSQLLETGMRQSFPSNMIINNIEIDAETDDPIWLENTLQSLSSLKRTSEPQINISGNTITIDGIVDTPETAEAVAMTLESVFDDSIQIVNKLKLVVPATLIDPELVIQKEDDFILLDGVVRSDQDKLKLADAIQSSFADSTVTNRLTVNPQAANALWMESVLTLIPGLTELKALDVMISRQGATVSGESTSEIDRAQQRKLIRSTLGQMVPVVSNLAVQTPTPEAQSEAEITTEPIITAEPEIVTDSNPETDVESESQANLTPTNNSIAQVAPEATAPTSMTNALNAVNTRNIRFQSASAVLTAESKLILDQMAIILLQYPSRGVNIMGHTDSRGDEQANLNLSEDRAEAVKQYMVSKDISETRMQAYGFGASSPIADNESAEGRALNRRIEFNY